MEGTEAHIQQLNFNTKIEEISVKITIHFSIVGELLSIQSPFWSLPKNARQFTYGNKAQLIEERLQEFTENYRFLLPLLALPEEILPGNLKEEDKGLAKRIRVEQSNFEYKKLKTWRSEIKDDWTKDLVHRAFHQQTIDFRKKLELIYELVLLQKTNSYQLINELKNQDDEIFVKPLLCGLSRNDLTFRSFASRWLGDHLSTEIVPDLIRHLSNSDAWVKTTILGFLEKLKAAEGMDKAMDLLQNDSSPKVQSKAAFYLGEMEDEKAVSNLLKAMQQDNWIVKQNALEALGKIGSVKAVAPLCDYLTNSPMNEKGDIIATLGNHPYPNVSSYIIPYLKNETHCFTTAYALGKLKDKTAIPALETFAQTIIHERRKQRVLNIIKNIQEA